MRVKKIIFEKNKDRILKNITGILNIDLSPYIGLLHSRYGDFIKPHDEGIYIWGRDQPIIVPNKIYYINMNGIMNQCFNMMSYFINYQGDIYTDKMDLLLNSRIVKNKNLFRLNKSFLPYREIKILYTLACQFLDNNNYYTQIIEHLNQDGKDLFRDDNMRFVDTLQRFFDLLHEFVGSDINHLYDVNIDAVHMRICKAIDYRVYLWELENNPEFKEKDFESEQENLDKFIEEDYKRYYKSTITF